MCDLSDSNSEFSGSSESFTSSSSSSLDSSKPGSYLEPIKLCRQVLFLPKDLCVDEDIFNEFFSFETWNDIPDNLQAYLKSKFLPQFPEGTINDLEQTRTVKQLFDDQISCFGKSPLKQFQKDLVAGNFRPDIVKIKKSIGKSKNIEKKFMECERISKLSKNLMISREKLLKAAYNSTPGEICKMDKFVNNTFNLLDNYGIGLRARKRFYREMCSIAKEANFDNLSDDEFAESQSLLNNYIQKTSADVSSLNTELKIIGTMQKQISSSGVIPFENEIVPASSMTDNHLKQMLYMHKKRKVEEKDRPEFETNEVRIVDINNRVEMTGSNYRKQILAPPKLRRKPLHSSSLGNIQKKKSSVLKKPHFFLKGKFSKLEQSEKQCVQEEEIPDKIGDFNINFRNILNSNGIEQKLHLNDNMKANLDHIILKETNEDTQFISTAKNEQSSSEQNSENNFNVGVSKMNPICLDGLGGIDVIEIPVDINDSVFNEVETIGSNATLNSTDKTTEVKTVVMKTIDKESEVKDLKTKPLNEITQLISNAHLTQKTHACFLSLIRDIFCSTPDHRMKIDELNTKLYQWLSNPIAALNDWYNQSENWLNLLKSAIHFLSGDFVDQPEDFVPYIEYKSQLDIYQWIGAGRDSDSHLLHLHQYWLSRKHEMGIRTVKSKEKRDIESKVINIGDNKLVHEKPVSPPPPRCPTNWTVQPATSDQIKEFREQERKRFENPHKAFTYKMYGYESVVGPVKGVYTQILALTKARGHNMLTADRPNFVTILTLVRDATARLPNGEGTRADICELLKCSQYINPMASDNILQTIVSGALDRMHVEIDPCVRYDAKRKIWIYLHRNRSEEEFEKIHQQYQGVTKNYKKSLTRKLKHKQQKAENSLLLQNKNITKPPAILPPLTVCSQYQDSPNKNFLFAKTTIDSSSTAVQPITSTVSKTQINTQSTPQIAVVAPLKVSQPKNVKKPELPFQIIQPQILVEKDHDIDDNVNELNEHQYKIQKSPSQKTNTAKTVISPTSTSNTTQLNQAFARNKSIFRNNKPSEDLDQLEKKNFDSILSQQQNVSMNTKTKIVSPISTQLPQKLLVSPTHQQSTQSLNSISNTQFIVANKIQKTGKPILIQSTNNTGQNILTHIQPNSNQAQTQNFLIPLNADQLQAMSNQFSEDDNSSRQTIFTNANKIIKPTVVSISNQTPSSCISTVTSSAAIFQTSPITSSKQQFIRIGNSTSSFSKVLNQHSINIQNAKSNNSLQVENSEETSIPFTQDNASANSSQTIQKISPGTIMIRPQIIKPNISSGFSLLKNQNVHISQPRQLVPIQQKQQSQTKLLQQATLLVSSSQSNQQIQPKKFVIQQTPQGRQSLQLQQQEKQTQEIQNIINVSVPSIQSSTNSSVQSSNQTTLISPQIIQVQAPSTSNSSNIAGTHKIQAFNTNVLPNTKPQNINLQTSVANQSGSQQHPIFIKQQIFQHNNQKQNLNNMKCGNTNSITPIINKLNGRNISSLTPENIITNNSISLTPGTIIQTSGDGTIKNSNLLQQSGKQFAIVSSSQQLRQQQQPHIITKVVKSISNNPTGTTILQSNQIVQTSNASIIRNPNTGGSPIMAKVITNNGGQIISLENLLQKQGIVSGTTLRVTGPKARQTNFTQLINDQSQYTNNSGKSDNVNNQNNSTLSESSVRNTISISGSSQRLHSVQNSNSVLTNLTSHTVSNVKTISGTALTGTAQQGNPIQMQTLSKIINTNQLAPQQILNAKVVGKNTNSNIKMNLTNIRGKPIIIANKQNNLLGSPVTAQGMGLIQNNQTLNSSSSPANVGNLLIGGQTIKVPGNGNIQVINQSASQPQTVVLGSPILKVAQASNSKQNINTNIFNSSGSMVSINNSNKPIQNEELSKNNQVQASIGSRTTLNTTSSSNIGINNNNLTGSTFSQNLGNVSTKTVVLGSTGQPIRVQSGGQIQTVSLGNRNTVGTVQQPNQIILSHPIKGTTFKSSNQQRVVLAVQGGGQILLPPGFQSGSVNIKSLQGLKVFQVGQQQNSVQTIQQPSQQNKTKD